MLFIEPLSEQDMILVSYLESLGYTLVSTIPENPASEWLHVAKIIVKEEIPQKKKQQLTYSDYYDTEIVMNTIALVEVSVSHRNICKEWLEGEKEFYYQLRCTISFG